MSDIPDPSYFEVVEPMLRADDGDASALLCAYPNFDPETVLNFVKHVWPYLHTACDLNHFHAVRGLLQCGASLRRKGAHGCTALHWACNGDEESRADVVAWLLSRCDDVRRSTVNWSADDGNTALHIAAWWGQTKMVCTLLEHGADITLENKQGKTPLQDAREEGHKATAEVLVAAAHVTLEDR